MIGVKKDEYEMNFTETELCLGLPGGSEKDNGKNSAKRGFSETMDLLTGLQSKDKETDRQKNQKQHQEEQEEENDHQRGEDRPEEKNLLGSSNNDDPPEPSAPKAQVVGWPPVRSFRRSISTIQKSDDQEKVNSSATFVKVSMDGAPYLRKVDLKLYKSYQELSHALGKMFSSFTIGNCESQGMKDFMNEKRLVDLLSGSEYQPTYEDRDGDWMLVGDVPWQMFVDSCKRIRIMKGSDAIGLAPRAVEKCRNRS